MTDGVHRIEAAYADGRVEVLRCECDWCEVWRAFRPPLVEYLRSVEPEHRPDWLPAGTSAPNPRPETDRFADIRRIAASMGVPR
jgi:hypothetical protein